MERTDTPPRVYRIRFQASYARFADRFHLTSAGGGCRLWNFQQFPAATGNLSNFFGFSFLLFTVTRRQYPFFIYVDGKEFGQWFDPRFFLYLYSFSSFSVWKIRNFVNSKILNVLKLTFFHFFLVDSLLGIFRTSLILNDSCNEDDINRESTCNFQEKWKNNF